MTSRNMETLQRLTGGSDFSKDRKTVSFEQTIAEVFTSDVEVHEPPSLPYGGVHKGIDSWLSVRRTMMSLFDQKIEVVNTWDIPDDDVIIMNHMNEWTAKATGRTARTAALNVLTFRDAKIAKIEVFFHDLQAVLDTLDPLDPLDPS